MPLPRSGFAWGRRGFAWGVTALSIAAVLWWWLVPTYPAYDAYWHLVWGRELLDGQLPSFEIYAAPTQHPLYVILAAALGLVGENADRLLVLAGLLSLVALVAGVWRVTDLLFGRWPAGLAALFCGSSFAFLLYAVRAYVDVPFLALVVWAAVVVVQGPRGRPGLRGGYEVRALLLLVLAGLLRPEAWVLAGLLWCWWARDAAWGHRIRWGGLVLFAPLVWVLSDWVVTGNPLHSLTSTSDLAEALGRERGLAKAPRLLVVSLFDVARAPVALAGIVGAVIAVRRFGSRAMAVPLALLLAGVITFFGAGVAGLSLLPRYLTVPAVGLCVFAGYAVAGFTSLTADHRWRAAWKRGALVAAVLGAGFFVWKLPSFGTLAGELRFVDRTHRQLVALIASPSVRTARGCGPLTFPTYRLVPDVRWVLGVGEREVTTRALATGLAELPRAGVAIYLDSGDRKARQRYGEADGVPRATNRKIAPGFVRLARRGPFVAYGRCG